MKTQHQFLGITTLGEKGQVVIPAEARKGLKLKAGDKLMVMMPHGNAVVLLKATSMETFAKGLIKKIAIAKRKSNK